MSNSSGLFITADRNRYSGPYDITIGEADGDDAVIAPEDNVRVKIGRGTGTPLLEVQSDAATSNGSTCSAANPTALSLEAADLTFPAGIYDIEVAIVDASDSNRIKKAELGVFVLRESLGGAVT
jgi:hypothetical protein